MNEHFYANRLIAKAIKEGECLICHIKPNSSGYSPVNVNGAYWYAHRLIYHAKIGPIAKTMCILHSCDRPRCINIDHLRLGTHKENHNDMVGRNRRNAPLPSNQKVTEEMVTIMRSLTESGLTYKQIGAALGICNRTVYEYIAGGRQCKKQTNL